MQQIYSVKMRASENGRHISGAERILSEDHLSSCLQTMADRALHHAKGKPDQIHLKIEHIAEEDLLQLPALPTSTVEVPTKEAGLQYMEEFLKNRGIHRAPEILQLLQESRNMRGAILLDPRTMQRLEDDPKKGVRVTYMDYKEQRPACTEKQHYREALALATKVLEAPGIFGELCISDDPDYVTGYISTRADGYVRITKLKEKGSAQGARIFHFTGTKEELPACMEFLTKRKVWIV